MSSRDGKFGHYNDELNAELDNDEDGVNAEESDVDSTVFMDHPVQFTPTIGSISSESAQHSVPTQEDQDGKMPPLSTSEKQQRVGTHPGALSVATKPSTATAVTASSPISCSDAHAIARAPSETVPSPLGPQVKYQSTASGSDGMHPILALGSTTTTTTTTINTSAAAPVIPSMQFVPYTAAEAGTTALVKFAHMQVGAASSGADALSPHPTPAHAAGVTSAPVDQIPDFKDQMRSMDPNQNRNTTKTNDAKLRSVPTGARATSGPRFKDQTDNIHSDEEMETKQDPELGKTRITEAVEDITSSIPGTMIDDNGDGATMSRHLVEAELVSNDPIDAAVELYEEKSYRKAWIFVVVVALAIGVVLSIVLPPNPNPSSPTMSPQMVPTECVNATSLELGGKAVAVGMDSSYTSILVDYTIPTCGSASSPSGNQTGVWFTFETNATVGVRISTCTDNETLNGDFDSQMLLFNGPCDQLDCFKGSDDEQGSEQLCGREAGVSFQALPSIVYYILVYGEVSDTATFGIQATTTQVSPSNDECVRPTTLLNGQSVNSTVLTANLTILNGNSCSNGFCDNFPTVWFLYESQMGYTTVSTCSPKNSVGHNIFVFSGPCSATEFLATDPVKESWDCNGVVNSLRFSSKSKSTYRIAVQSAIDRSSAQTNNPYLNVSHRIDGDVGEDFAIIARNAKFELATNGICKNASSLVPGSILQGSTFGASMESVPFCNFLKEPIGSATEGVWFKVLGNNTWYTASACTGGNVDIDFKSQINVYSGHGCQNLSCVAFNDNRTCNNGATFFAEQDAPYWIRVFSFVSPSKFPIAVFPTPVNQVCNDATRLAVGQPAVKGTTQGALAGPQGSRCGGAALTEGAPAVWYTVTGIDEYLTATTCPGNSTESLFYNQIIVYNGTCGNLTCVGEAEVQYDQTNCSGSQVSWFAEADVVYYIEVMDSYSVGNFEVEISLGLPYSIPANDLCENAQWLHNKRKIIAGGLETATKSSTEFDFCDGDSMDFHSTPDVWYKFRGTGLWHTVTTCTGIKLLDDSGFDSFLAIYSGACGNLTCIASNDDFYGTSCSSTNAVASWLTEKNETYLIRLSGIVVEYYSPEYGITINDGQMISLPEPKNNNCKNATALELDQTFVEGTTDGATGTDGLRVCGQGVMPTKPSVADVWYSIVGTGEYITVSTCSLNWENIFGPALVVYRGTCTKEMVCIEGNFNGNNIYDFVDECPIAYDGVSWSSELNVIYLIRIYWTFDSSGPFGVAAYSGTPDGKIPDSSTISPTIT